MLFRCSSLPRIFECPASAHAPELPMTGHNPFADMGSAVHAAMEWAILGDHDAIPAETDFAVILKKHNVPEEFHDETRILSHMAMQLWRPMREEIDVRYVERRMSHHFNVNAIDYTLGGHGDVIGMTKDELELVVVDWKTGYVEKNYHHQLMGYLWLARNILKWKGPMRYVVGLVRARELDQRIVGDKDMKDWEEELLAIFADARAQAFAPGEACEFCPRWNECPARSRMIQNAARELMEIEVKGDGDVEAILFAKDNFPLVYGKIKSLEKTLKRVNGLIRSKVERDGPLPVGGGKELYVGEPSKREKILFNAQSYKVIAQAVADNPPKPKEEGQPAPPPVSTMDFLGQVVTVGKKDLLDGIAEHAGKGQKQKVKDKLMDDLRGVAAVEESMVAGKIGTRNIRKELSNGRGK